MANIYQFMLENHDDLMRGQDKEMSEESMWKGYQRSKKPG